MSRQIRHSAVIMRVEEGALYVSIESPSQCDGCAIMSYCRSNGGKDDTFEVKVNDATTYAIGQRITIGIEQNMRQRATYSLLVLPVVAMMVVMAVTTFCGMSDTVVAISALVTVVVFYVVLRLCRSRIEKNVKWQIILD